MNIIKYILLYKWEVRDFDGIRFIEKSISSVLKYVWHSELFEGGEAGVYPLNVDI